MELKLRAQLGVWLSLVGHVIQGETIAALTLLLTASASGQSAHSHNAILNQLFESGHAIVTKSSCVYIAKLLSNQISYTNQVGCKIIILLLPWYYCRKQPLPSGLANHKFLATIV